MICHVTAVRSGPLVPMVRQASCSGAWWMEVRAPVSELISCRSLVCCMVFDVMFNVVIAYLSSSVS